MHWVIEAIEALGYAGVALVMLLETALPVLPSELTLPFIGFVAARGDLTVLGAVLAATGGTVAGALILYEASRRYGHDAATVLAARLGRHIGVDERGLRRAEGAFRRFGPLTVFFCRMVPVLRCLISIPAGITRMAPAVFVIYTALGALLWNTVLIYCGAALGRAWEQVGHWAHIGGYAALGACIVAWGAHRWLSTHRRPSKRRRR